MEIVFGGEARLGFIVRFSSWRKEATSIARFEAKRPGEVLASLRVEAELLSLLMKWREDGEAVSQILCIRSVMAVDRYFEESV